MGILACAFDQWYDDFKHVTIKSQVLRLPEGFVKFLMTDGIQLPTLPDRDGIDSGSDDWGDGGNDSPDDEGQELAMTDAEYRDLVKWIRDKISALGGGVLPKLNWSAPKDAAWMVGTLRCATADDVIMLLKASDFVSHDLHNAFDHCRSEQRRTRPDHFCLVLRQWRTVEESGEFRCFVHSNRLCAVSQRHGALMFPHLSEKEEGDTVNRRIARFWEESVVERFPLTRYVFDVLVGPSPDRRVRLIDFSPWGPSTDPLLFDWEELAEFGSRRDSEPEFRVVGNEHERRGKLENYHALPVEVAQMGNRSAEELDLLFKRASRDPDAFQ